MTGTIIIGFDLIIYKLEILHLQNCQQKKKSSSSHLQNDKYKRLQ